MDLASVIDLLARGGAIALLSAMAPLLWRAGGAHRFHAGACLCGGLYLLLGQADVASALGGLRAPLAAVAATGPLWFLMAVRRGFGAPGQLKTSTLALIAAGLFALAWVQPLAAELGAPLAVVFFDLILLGLFVAAVATVWIGLADDLDAGRRSQRFVILGLSGGFGALVALSALLDTHAPEAWGLGATLPRVIAIGAFGLTLGYVLSAVRLKEPKPRAKASSPAGRSTLAERINAVLMGDRLYRQSDLTLAVLARTLGVPEHHLRQAINTDLGAKNFSEFVNAFRLEEVKAALADPAQAEVPISTIALDAGFGSIASFNRVFKAATGLAPRDFRRQMGA